MTIGLAINKRRYINAILTRLLPFINEHHRTGDYLFWSGIACSHYANENINYLQKIKNPLKPEA